MKQRAALAGKLHSLRRDLCVRFAASSALRLAAQCAAAFGACFFLAGIRLLGRSVPAALALLAAMPFSLAAVCSLFEPSALSRLSLGAAGVFVRGGGSSPSFAFFQIFCRATANGSRPRRRARSTR